jgi:hypothetical protein
MVTKIKTTTRLADARNPVSATIRPSEGTATLRFGPAALLLTRAEVAAMIDTLEEIEEALEP